MNIVIAVMCVVTIIFLGLGVMNARYNEVEHNAFVTCHKYLIPGSTDYKPGWDICKKLSRQSKEEDEDRALVSDYVNRMMKP